MVGRSAPNTLWPLGDDKAKVFMKMSFVYDRK